MLIIDMHCDTLDEIYKNNARLYSNIFHVDLKRMRHSDHNYIQTFAIYLNPRVVGLKAFETCNKMIDYFSKEVELNKDDFKLCLSSKDIASTKLGGLLSIEGAACLNNDLRNLQHFYDRGVRMLSLTWNKRNELGCGIVDSYDEQLPDELKGLTNFGVDVVHTMNKLGMIIDVSHLSEQAFYEVCYCSSSPIVASHSNSRTVCNNIRNLTDNQLLYLKNTDGIVGINFNPDFLNTSGQANIDDIVKHIEYITALIGEDYIGLGTDFDGIETTPTGIIGIENIYDLFNRLLKMNYSEQFIKKFSSENFIRVMNNALV